MIKTKVILSDVLRSFLLKEKNQKFPTFWLAPDCICSFGLTQKNQKVKAAPASLLTPFISLFAPQTRLRLKQATLTVAPFRSLALRSPAEANPFSLFSPSASRLLTTNYQLPTTNFYTIYYICVWIDWPNVRGVKQIPSGA